MDHISKVKQPIHSWGLCLAAKLHLTAKRNLPIVEKVISQKYLHFKRLRNPIPSSSLFSTAVLEELEDSFARKSEISFTSVSFIDIFSFASKYDLILVIFVVVVDVEVSDDSKFIITPAPMKQSAW